MAEIANHTNQEPWPSLKMASWLFDRASAFLVLSLVFGLAATVLIVWMGIVKEHHWDLLRESAQKKIAELNKSTEELKAANLALEKQVEPRRLSADQMNEILAELIPFAGKRVRFESYTQDVESAVLAKQLMLCFREAGLIVSEKGMMSIQTFGRVSLGIHVHGEQQFADALSIILKNRGGLVVEANSDPVTKGGGVTMRTEADADPSDATVFIGVKPITIPIIEFKKK